MGREGESLLCDPRDFLSFGDVTTDMYFFGGLYAQRTTLFLAGQKTPGTWYVIMHQV